MLRRSNDHKTIINDKWWKYGKYILLSKPHFFALQLIFQLYFVSILLIINKYKILQSIKNLFFNHSQSILEKLDK